MKPLRLPLLVLLVAACVTSGWAEQSCKLGECVEDSEDGDDEGAAKYSRERNKPGDLHSQMGLLQAALINLIRDPHNPDVLRESLAELSLFADTPQGKLFMDKASEVLSGDGGGATGALVRQVFAAVLSGDVDVAKAMQGGLNAGTLASLASSLLKKRDGGDAKSIKPEDVTALMKNFMDVIREEQASPFLLDRLSEVFRDALPEEQLKSFERAAAGVLGNIRSAAGEDDSNFVYDQSALDTFESFMQDFVDEQEWDWSKNGPTLMSEIKRVMRLFPGSEDQIGRLLPSVMESIADAKPTGAHLKEVINSFGGILGHVVKKDDADPEFVKTLVETLKNPPKQQPSVKQKESKEDKKDGSTPKKAEEDKEEKDKPAPKVSSADVDEAIRKAEKLLDDVPDMSKLVSSLGALGNNPAALQAIMMKMAASGGKFDLSELSKMVPEVEGLDEVAKYFGKLQDSADEKEIAGHFHKVMDAVGSAFTLLSNEEVRRTSFEQMMPYIKMAHEFLKDPLALLKLQMGANSLASMYQLSVSDLVDMAAPHVEEGLAPLGVEIDFRELTEDGYKFLLKVYNEVYQSPKSVFKKLSGVKEETYLVETLDHSVGEPMVHVYAAYAHIRRNPECILQTLCRANRNVKETDTGKYGVRTSFTKGMTRLFGLLLAASEHSVDSPLQEQIKEAVDEGLDAGRCEDLYPGDCTDGREEMGIAS